MVPFWQERTTPVGSFFLNLSEGLMIKIWNVTIKKSTERRKDIAHSIGIEEENHELIVWKHWVGFLPKNDFFHHVILRQNLYILMDALLKIGTYSICMKREDNTHLYSANIVGISPYMLENVTGYERHTILAKFQDLTELGYISFTAPTRGELSEMNILLNEYNKAGLQVFKIEERSWLNERLLVEKESLFGNYKDIREIANNNVGLVDLLPINTTQQTGRLVEMLPDKPVDIVDNLVDNSASLVESLPIKRVNIVDDLDETEDSLISRDATNDRLCNDDGLSGISKTLIIMLKYAVWNNKGVSTYTKHLTAVDSVVDCSKEVEVGDTRRSSSLSCVSTKNDLRQKTESAPNQGTPTPLGSANHQTAGGLFLTDLTKYPTTTRIVAMFYQQETGVDVTESDISFITEALKISAIPQIVTAIQSAKVWRATLPANFASLNEPEKKQRVAESQPGFYLRKMGMRHVYNFLKNSPRYRKRSKRGTSTGVVSGLNRKRALAKQTKIMQEIRAKHKQEIEQIK